VVGLAAAAFLWFSQSFPQSKPARSEQIRLVEGWRFAKDAEDRGRALGFARAEFVDSAWSPIRPGDSWESQGFAGYDGIGWYRLRFRLERAPQSDALLELGAVADADETFVNGERVGAVGIDRPGEERTAGEERRYWIPRALLKEGENQISVRVFDGGGEGGILGALPQLRFTEQAAELARMAARRPTGFACANFAFFMEMAPDGEFPARICWNPPWEGERVEQIGLGSLSIREGRVEVPARSALTGAAERAWPFARAGYASERIRGIVASVEAFSPVAPGGHPFWPAVPVGLASLRAKNVTDRERVIDFLFRFAFEGDLRGVVSEPRGNIQVSGFDSEAFSARTTGETCEFSSGDVRVWGVRLRVPPGGEAVVPIAFARSPRTRMGAQSAAWPSSEEIASDAVRTFQEARAVTAAIDGWIPRTGVPEIDSALRWYLANAMICTKIAAETDAAILTGGGMGIEESYWASDFHKVIFPGIERRMVTSTFLAQGRDGSVPDAVLPARAGSGTARSSAAAILRAFRDALWTVDFSITKNLAANLKGAAVWMTSLDRNGNGLPEESAPAEAWRGDLPEGAESPATAALARVALAQVLLAMEQGGDSAEAVEGVRAKAAAIERMLDRNFSEGGLWDGARYVARRGKTPEAAEVADLAIPLFFGGLRTERAAAVADDLRARRAPEPIRPWLLFLEAWTRASAGRTSEAIDLLSRGARADLLATGEALAHEALDGKDGRPLGRRPYAGSSIFFGAVFHGVLGVARQPSGLLQVAPRNLGDRLWRVSIPIPEGDLEVAAESADAVAIRWVLRSELAVHVAPEGFPSWLQILKPGSGSHRLTR